MDRRRIDVDEIIILRALRRKEPFTYEELVDEMSPYTITATEVYNVLGVMVKRGQLVLKNKKYSKPCKNN